MYTPCELVDIMDNAILKAKSVDERGGIALGFVLLGMTSPIWYPIYVGGCIIKNL